MPDSLPDHDGQVEPRKPLEEEVVRRETRKLRARSEKDRTLWFGLGMFGLVGWSVAVPALVGTALGVWLDRAWPQRFSWTLTLLLAGMALGCANAWYWLSREQRNIDREGKGPTVNEALTALPALAGGFGLGLIFFGGLWWTVRRLPTAANPALLFLGSFLLRTGAVLAGFYFLAAGRWERLLACLVGFILARLLLVQRLKSHLQEAPGSNVPNTGEGTP